MSQVLFVVAVVLLLLLLAGSGSFVCGQVVIRISPTGQDNPSCGSLPMPCASVNGALAVLGSNPGAPVTLAMAAGTYTGANNTAVTLNNANWIIHLQGAPPTASVINAQGSTTGWVLQQGIYNFSDVVFTGFGTTALSVQTGVSSAAFVDCNFTANSTPLSGGKGGAVYSYADVTFTRCFFGGNSAWYSVLVGGTGGGAVYLENGYATLTDCVFVGNTAANDAVGGAAFVTTSYPANFINCVFRNNSAGNGGAVWMSNNAPQLFGCTFVANTAMSQCTGDCGGGALYYSAYFNAAKPPIVENCTFANNVAAQGGAIMSGSIRLIIYNSSFSFNTATYGGAVRGWGPTGQEIVSIQRCLFLGNTATSGDGGAVFGSIVFVSGSSFQSNMAATTSGALMAYVLSVDSSQFYDNAAQQTGGAVRMYEGSPTFTNCTFVGNWAPQGGAVYGEVYTVAPVFQNCSFSLNSATYVGGTGGAISASPASVYMHSCEFVNNTAGGHGGALYQQGAVLSLYASVFIGNTAQSGNGGGVYLHTGKGVVYGSQFGNNTAQFGGAVFGAAAFNVSGSSMIGNRALQNGGAIAGLGPGIVNASSLTVEANTAVFGGGLYVAGNGSFIVNSTIRWNVAGYAGGGIACNARIDLDAVAGLPNNSVISADNQNTAALTCISDACVVYTRNMVPLAAPCQYMPLPVMYVALTGDDYPACGASFNPCATIQYAASIATATPIVIRLAAASLAGANCALTSAAFPRAVVIEGDPNGGSVLACATTAQPVLAFHNGETPASLVLRNVAVQLGAAPSVVIQGSSPLLSDLRFIINQTSTVQQAFLQFVDSNAVLVNVTLAGTTTTPDSIAPLMVASCSNPASCPHLVSCTNCTLARNIGTATLLASAGASVALVGCNITHNAVTAPGLSVRAPIGASSGGVVTVVASNVSYNTGLVGGALAAVGGVLNVFSTALVSNSALQNGGALAVTAAGSVHIANSSLWGNSAGVSGGAAAVSSAVLLVTRTIFANNSAAATGGAVYAEFQSLVQLCGVVVTANSAPNGAAAFISGSQLSFFNNTVVEGHRGDITGAVYVESGTLSCRNSTLRNNSAPGDGGAIFAVQRAMVLLQGCALLDNHGGALGGTLSILQSLLLCTGTVFARSRAAVGGTLFLSGSVLQLYDSAIAEGCAGDAGGGIAALFSSLELVGAQVTNCSAPDGGALFSVGSAATLNNTVLADNRAGGNGGAVYGLSGSLDVTSCTMSGNQGGAGGAIGTQALTALQVQNTSFTSNAAELFGGAINIDDHQGLLALHDCLFQFNSAGGLAGALYVYRSTTPLLATGCHWVNNSAPTASAVSVAVSSMLADCSVIGNRATLPNGGAVVVAPLVANTALNVTLNTTVLLSNVGGTLLQYGGVLLATGCTAAHNANPGCNGGVFALSGTTFLLESCWLVNNTASSGGAISGAAQSSIALLSCTVFGNAVDANGGAVVLDATSTVVIAGAHCQLAGNNAFYGGGGVVYTASGSAAHVLVDNACIIQGNNAAYGRLRASLAVRLQLRTDATLMTLPSQPLTNALQIDAVDAYGQQVVSLTGAQQAPVIMLPGSANTTVLGQSVQSMANGSAVFAAGTVQVSAPTSTIVTVQFVSGALARAIVQFSILPCPPGYELTNAGQALQCSPCAPGFYKTRTGSQPCSACPAGTAKGSYGNGSCVGCSPGYYAPFSAAAECTQAPANAIAINNSTAVLVCPSVGVSCAGGIVLPNPDYFTIWYNQSVVPLRCRAGACAGGAALPSSALRPTYDCHDPSSEMDTTGLVSGYCSWNNACTGNRTGFMCGACSVGTSYGSPGACVACDGPSPVRIALQVLLNWTVVIVIYILLSSSSGGLTKLLVEYGQLALLLAPDTEANAVLQLLNVHVPTLGGCALPLDYYGYFVQRLVTPVIQLGQLALSFAVLTLATRLFTGAWADRKRWLWTPTVALLVACYEPLTDSAFGVLHCVPAAGFDVLADAPAFDCGSVRHGYYARIAVGIVVAVTALFPIALIVLLVVLRKRLDAETVKSRLGLLYKEYRPAMRWWLVVSLLRRTLLVGLQLMPNTQLSALVSLLAVAAFFVAHRWLHPLDHALGNVVQEVAFFSLILVAAGSVAVAFAQGQQQLQAVALGVQYSVAVLVLVTLVILLVITVWSARHDLYAVWVIVRASVQLLHHRARQWSTKQAVRTEASLTESLMRPEAKIATAGAGFSDLGDDRL